MGILHPREILPAEIPIKEAGVKGVGRSHSDQRPYKVKPGKGFHPKPGQLELIIGGETGIRTLGRVAPSLVFETSPFDRSGISPQ